MFDASYKTPGKNKQSYLSNISKFKTSIRYYSEDFDQMPEDYNIDSLRYDLECLRKGLENAQSDTIKTNLYNILRFIAAYYDLYDPAAVLNQLLDSFCQLSFLDCSMVILSNVKDVDSILYLFEILCRIFDIITDKHPIQDKVTDKLLASVADIAISPSLILPQEKQNYFSFENISLNNLYNTKYNIPAEKYDNIQILGICCISSLCNNRNDLLQFTFENICPRFRNLFINNNEGNAGIINELVRLFAIVIGGLNINFIVDDLMPYAQTFILKLKMNNIPLVWSIYGLTECVGCNLSIVDNFIETSLFEQLNFLLLYEDTEVQKYTLILISEMLKTSSQIAKQELLKFINWKHFNAVAQKTKLEDVHCAFCKSTKNIIKYTPVLANIFFDEGIINTVTKIIESSSFETKLYAIKCIHVCVSSLDSTRIHELVSNKIFFETMIDLLEGLDDDTSQMILETLTDIFQVGVATKIVQVIAQQGLFEPIEKAADLLCNVENERLFETATKFLDDLQRWKQELEEFNEVGD